MKDKEAPSRLSHHQMDRLTLGELSPEERRGFERQLAEDPASQARWEARQARFASLEASAEYQELMARLTQAPDARSAASTPSEPAGSWWQRWWQEWHLGARLGLAAAGGLALVLLLPPLRLPPPHRPLQIARSKGAPLTLELLAKTRGKSAAFRVRDGQTLYPGDLIQLSYRRLDPKVYLMLVSLQGRGKIERYYPDEGPGGALLRSAQGVLPAQQTWELDDALGRERLFMVFATKPLSFRTFKRRLAQAYRSARGKIERVSAVKGPWQLSTVWFHKKARRAKKP